MNAAASPTTRRVSPQWASWKRCTVLTCLLLIGAAMATAGGHSVRPWQIAAAAALTIAFLGSWRGQLISTSVRRWVPMALRNRSGHSGSATPTRHESPPATRPSSGAVAHIMIHLRPQAHRVITAPDPGDQLPWQTVLSWMNRYGIRAQTLSVSAVTRIPPLSALRRDRGPLVTGRTPQHRDTWIRFTLSADDNVDALRARQITIGDLADITARRLIAELRENGWLATLSGDQDQLPGFVPPSVTIRRECWTATEYSDGFRAAYAVDPSKLTQVLPALAAAARTTWVCATVRSRPSMPSTIEVCVGLLTPARPAHTPMEGLRGFHGRHHELSPQIGAEGVSELSAALESAAIDPTTFTLPWPTSAVGVPIGTDRDGRPHYLGIASPEPVRITVTGTPEFGLGIVSRLALSGLPIAVYTPGQRWQQLANHAGPQQVLLDPKQPPAGSIIVTDESRAFDELPAGRISVLLRRPQHAAAPTTTIVITQTPQHPELFDITTARARQRLSTRL